MEEVNELFVPENKLNLALADAATLPTLSITEVTSLISLTGLQPLPSNEGHIRLPEGKDQHIYQLS